MVTKIYVRMCEKSEEIQKLFEPKIYDLHLWAGDLFHDWDRERFNYDGYVDLGGVKKHQFKGKYDGSLWHCIWLPTEEQLQEIAMTLESLKDRVMEPFWELVDQFNYFLWGGETRKYVSQFGSFKELWFAFVMKEKYNKTWDGEDWRVKEVRDD